MVLNVHMNTREKLKKKCLTIIAKSRWYKVERRTTGEQLRKRKATEKSELPQYSKGDLNPHVTYLASAIHHHRLV